MPWFKVDDAFHGHPKVITLSPEAVGVWTLTGSWCANYLTDGEVHANIARRFGGTSENVQELVDADLWIDNGDGTYQFKDWDHYQPVKEDVEAEKSAARERMRLVRARKKGVTEPPDNSENVRANFGRSSEKVRVTPSRPSPSQSQSQSQPSADASEDTDTADAAFEDWYQDYPKKIAKGQAKKAFKAALKKTDLDTLKAGLATYTRSVQGKDKTFIANPATWLNGERWDDETLTDHGEDQWQKFKNWTTQN